MFLDHNEIKLEINDKKSKWKIPPPKHLTIKLEIFKNTKEEPTMEIVFIEK